MRFLVAVVSAIAPAGALERPLAAQCTEVRRDIEYHCRYRALDPRHQDVSFTRLSDNSVRASSLDGSDADAELVLETLVPFRLGDDGGYFFRRRRGRDGFSVTSVLSAGCDRR